MNWEEYISEISAIVNGQNTQAPYNDDKYVNYAKLNDARIRRWLKSPDLILDETKKQIAQISDPQKWILILEPWCADGAHIAPVIYLLAGLSEKIDLEIQLRDSENSIIDQYLTNGSRSIPKLIVRDSTGNDLFTWGARPSAAQNYFMDLKNAGTPIDECKAALQVWYNKDKGIEIQNEIVALVCQNSIIQAN